MARHDIRDLPGEVSARIGNRKVNAMRTMFRADLDRLITDLARMARRAGQMVTNASNALHQNDITLLD